MPEKCGAGFFWHLKSMTAQLEKKFMSTKGNTDCQITVNYSILDRGWMQSVKHPFFAIEMISDFSLLL